MQNHRARYILIAIATLSTIIALVVAGAYDASESVLTALAGALSMLVPAMLDAYVVEQRRVTPGATPVADDIQTETSES